MKSHFALVFILVFCVLLSKSQAWSVQIALSLDEWDDRYGGAPATSIPGNVTLETQNIAGSSFYVVSLPGTPDAVLVYGLLNSINWCSDACVNATFDSYYFTFDYGNSGFTSEAVLNNVGHSDKVPCSTLYNNAYNQWSGAGTCSWSSNVVSFLYRVNL